jgi:hypothetical protein
VLLQVRGRFSESWTGLKIFCKQIRKQFLGVRSVL